MDLGLLPSTASRLSAFGCESNFSFLLKLSPRASLLSTEPPTANFLSPPPNGDELKKLEVTDQSTVQIP